MNLRPVFRVIVRLLTKSLLFNAVLGSAILIVFFLTSLTGMDIPDSLRNIILEVYNPGRGFSKEKIFEWYLIGVTLFSIIAELLYYLHALKRSLDIGWIGKLKRIATFLGILSILGVFFFIVGNIPNFNIFNSSLIFALGWIVSVGCWAIYLSLNAYIEMILNTGIFDDPTRWGPDNKIVIK